MGRFTIGNVEIRNRGGKKREGERKGVDEVGYGFMVLSMKH